MAQHLNPIPPQLFLWEEALPGGCHWSGILPPRQHAAPHRPDRPRQRLARCSTTREEKLERYNMPDTLKAQHTAHLTTGHVLLFRHGPRAVLDHRRHLRLARHRLRLSATPRWSCAKYGEATYQTHRNAMYRNGRDGLLVELGKWGLGKRDLVPNVNFFSKVVADEDGRLQFVDRPLARRRPRRPALRDERAGRAVRRAASARLAPRLRAGRRAC